jgi:pimeloyl-ACP methyl ester carboxylesterase
MANTSLLLVHGAWHGSWCWDRVLPALETAGFTPTTVELPSHGDDTAALGGLHDDAAAVRAAAAELPDGVVVMAHSYGGAAITEGLSEAPNVRHLVYLAAFMLDAGESVLGAAGGSPPPFWEATPDGKAWRPLNPEDVFFNDCSPDDTAWAVSRLQPQSASSFAETLEAAAWRERPSTYVVCERDQALPVFAQEAMAKRAGDAVRLDSGHSPFLARPDELVTILSRFA